MLFRSSAGFKKNGSGPFGRGFAIEILEEGNVAGGVSRDDVFVAIAVPVVSDRGGESSKLEVVGFLLEVSWWQEIGSSVGIDLSGVFHEGDASVFIPHNEVLVAVLIPIDGGRSDHLHMHAVGEPDSGCVSW